jgi:O-glycosyl hydrolase
LKQQSSISFSAGSGSAPTIFVDETEADQSIEGFGVSFTDSAAYLLNEKVPPSEDQSAFKKRFRAGRTFRSFQADLFAAHDVELSCGTRLDATRTASLFP